MANFFLLSSSLANSLNPLILRVPPVMVESHLWLLSNPGVYWHHQCSSLPHHHYHSLLLGRKLILIVRGLEFHRPQWNLRCNGHHLLKERMSDSYGIMTVAFAYHTLKTTLTNCLHSTRLDDIDSFQPRLEVIVFFNESFRRFRNSRVLPPSTNPPICQLSPASHHGCWHSQRLHLLHLGRIYACTLTCCSGLFIPINSYWNYIYI